MRLGSLTLPDYRLPVLVSDVKKIQERFPGQVVRYANKNPGLARLLGYSSTRNGAFLSKLTAMRAYGLLQGRATHVIISTLAKRVINGENVSDQQKAYHECVMRIFLWRELLDRHGFSLPTAPLWQELTVITGCTEADARNSEALVRKAYAEDMAPLSLSQPVKTPGQVEEPAESQFIEIHAGDLHMKLPFTGEYLDMAIDALRKLKTQPEEHLKPRTL